MYSIADAKKQRSAVIDRALKGEGVVITRRGAPVVALRPVTTDQARAVTQAYLDTRPGAPPRPEAAHG
jgi:prevent-host-death family protein